MVQALLTGVRYQLQPTASVMRRFQSWATCSDRSLMSLVRGLQSLKCWSVDEPLKARIGFHHRFVSPMSPDTMTSLGGKRTGLLLHHQWVSSLQWVAVQPTLFHPRTILDALKRTKIKNYEAIVGSYQRQQLQSPQRRSGSSLLSKLRFVWAESFDSGFMNLRLYLASGLWSSSPWLLIFLSRYWLHQESTCSSECSKPSQCFTFSWWKMRCHCQCSNSAPLATDHSILLSRPSSTCSSSFCAT